MRRMLTGCCVLIFAVSLTVRPASADDATDLYKQIEELANTRIDPADKSRAEVIKLVNEQVSKIMAQCEEYRKKYPAGENLSDVLAHQANAYAMAAQFKRSPEILEKASEIARLLLKKFPKAPAAAVGHEVLMRNALRTRKSSEALTHAKAIVKDFPKSESASGALFFMAVIYDREGKDKETIAALEKLVEGYRDSRYWSQADGMLRLKKLKGSVIELSFTTTDGTEIDIKNYRGNVVLIDFWASWCGPCVAEMPNVVRSEKLMRDRGFRVIGINLDYKRKQMDDFIKKYNMPWPQYFDGKGWNSEMGRKFGIRSIPQTFLIDKKGVVREVGVRGGALQRAIRKLVDEK